MTNRELEARRAVAHAVRHIRRWDEPGILAAWDAATKRGYSFVAIAVCFLEISADDTAKTPGVLLSRLANGWRRERDTPTPLPQLERCPSCHLRHRPDSPCGDGTGSAPNAAEVARLALVEAQVGLCPHKVPWANCLQHTDTQEEA